MSSLGLGQVTGAPSGSKTAHDLSELALGPNPEQKLLAQPLEALSTFGLGRVSAMSPPGLGQVTVAPKGRRTKRLKAKTPEGPTSLDDSAAAQSPCQAGAATATPVVSG